MKDAMMEMVMATRWVVMVRWVMWDALLWLWTFVVPAVGLPGSGVDKLACCCARAGWWRL